MNPRDWIKSEFVLLEPFIEKIKESPFYYQFYFVSVPGWENIFMLFRFTSMGWQFDRQVCRGYSISRAISWFYCYYMLPIKTLREKQMKLIDVDLRVKELDREASYLCQTKTDRFFVSHLVFLNGELCADFVLQRTLIKVSTLKDIKLIRP